MEYAASAAEIKSAFIFLSAGRRISGKKREVRKMRNFYMYMCDGCGFSRERPGICPFCQAPLSIYSKEVQAEYQVDMEEAMRTMSDYRWYV